MNSFFHLATPRALISDQFYGSPVREHF